MNGILPCLERLSLLRSSRPRGKGVCNFISAQVAWCNAGKNFGSSILSLLFFFFVGMNFDIVNNSSQFVSLPCVSEL